MHRIATRAATALSVAALVSTIGVGSAMAASKSTFEAVAGNFTARANATALQAKLTKAGWKGYVVEAENTGTKGHFQVERPFATKAAAQAEVAKLKSAKYRGALETDSGTI